MLTSFLASMEHRPFQQNRKSFDSDEFVFVETPEQIKIFDAYSMIESITLQTHAALFDIVLFETGAIEKAKIIIESAKSSIRSTGLKGGLPEIIIDSIIDGKFYTLLSFHIEQVNKFDANIHENDFIKGTTTDFHPYWNEDKKRSLLLTQESYQLIKDYQTDTDSIESKKKINGLMENTEKIEPGHRRKLFEFLAESETP